MPLGRRNLRHQLVVHSRIANAWATCQRTGIRNEVLVEKPYQRPLQNDFVFATDVVTHVSQDWKAGDFLKIEYKEKPGVLSTSKQVKFIHTDADGVPWVTLIVLGSFDV